MKLLTDLLPIILFFIVYKHSGIYPATATAIVASALFVIGGYLWTKKIDKMQILTLAIITVLGGCTLLLHNELFIKWKPTIVEWLFACVFFCSQWVGEKPLMQRMLENNIELPTAIWYRLNMSWALFFALMGALNLYIIYHFSTNAWVNFKLFGLLGCTVVFIIGQAIYLAKHMVHKHHTGHL